MKNFLIIGSVLLAAVVGTSVWLTAAPSVGPVAATPAYVVINTSTSVLFTATITDPSVIPTGVDLLQVDAAGKTIRVVGTMRDDGAAGDALTGDNTCSLRVSVNRGVIGQEYYRVSAAFRGVLQRVQSSTVSVYIDPIKLPPDPGEAGRQTLAGIDSDKDGVRDDIQRYIAYKFHDSAKRRAALSQYAVALNGVIIADTPSATQAAWTRSSAALMCLMYVQGSARAASTLFTELRAEFLNTDIRIRAYFAANRFPPVVSVDESLATTSDDRKIHCASDPDNMPN